MRRLGPELKMPDVKGLKVPTFLADLFYDLRDRRLLPLILFVVVAIVSVPFLLGGDSEEAVELPSDGGISAALDSAKARSSRLTVVEAKPGLRDYRERLRGREPTDPFQQRYTGSSLEGAELNEKEGGSGGSQSKSETTSKSTTDGSSADGGSAPAPSPGGAPPSNPPPSGQGGPKDSGLVFYAFAINVRIVKSVGGEGQEPIVRERVLPQTPLPDNKSPVVTYMGAARDGKKANGKALLLVSDQVREIAGDANCLSGDETCQLLEVEPGFPVVLSYGEGDIKYTVNVLKLGLVVTGRG